MDPTAMVRRNLLPSVSELNQTINRHYQTTQRTLQDRPLRVDHRLDDGTIIQRGFVILYPEKGKEPSWIFSLTGFDFTTVVFDGTTMELLYNTENEDYGVRCYRDSWSVPNGKYLCEQDTILELTDFSDRDQFQVAVKLAASVARGNGQTFVLMDGSKGRLSPLKESVIRSYYYR